ncbi:MAG: arylsulfatase [Phycisphaeraceae bacterium]|nr:arylsulfatase [Phycisphaeraceae bacterium]
MPDDNAPNVLLICADHWPAAMTRPAGHPVVMTPTFAHLSRSGVNYTNAYSACPVCGPARRSLMTGLTCRSHGDRTFRSMPLPEVMTLAGAFRDAGYQSGAVGKLHVTPQRDRIGFDDVCLNEEGRCHGQGFADDYEQYLVERGFGGMEFASGMCNNDYLTRTWHLPDDCHPTNWTAAETCRMIHRRDPGRPGFWTMSFTAPHPPLWPLEAYMAQYRSVEMDATVTGAWAENAQRLPWLLRQRLGRYAIEGAPPHEVDLARRAFYALITHIDHQIRVVIGYLREQGLIDNTIIAITSDHGEMLGDHRMWAKGVMYERSANVPLLIVPALKGQRVDVGRDDDRLAELRDVMPTLLDLAGVGIPDTVEGISLVGHERRSTLYGEIAEDETATRMLRDARYKLVYYPAGNHRQLFDLENDPRENHDLAGDPARAEDLSRLTEQLVERLYGSDEKWLDADGALVGLPDRPVTSSARPDLLGQRGLRFP